MEVIRDPGAFPRPAAGSAVTIGAYDGVHLGHRALIGQVRELADERGLASVVVTFDRHPAMVVRPESAPKLLTDLEQKLELLASTGVDYTLVIHFDERRAHEPAEEFVEEILVGALHAKVVSVGEDFHFGHKRRGNLQLLEAMGETSGYDVRPLALVAIAGVEGPVSSTRIRNALIEGDVELAARLLGRPHEVRGVVQHGDPDGRGLGFPTATVAVPRDILLPADGTYAGWYRRVGHHEAQAAVISVGRRPTADGEPDASLGIQLLDADGNVPDEGAHVCFVARAREALERGA